MDLRAVEVYPGLVTEAVLDAYAQYLLSRAGSPSASRTDNSHDVEHKNSQNLSSTVETPQSLEEALAPLELLYGKTALSAIGIVLHGAEPVIRYVEEVDLSLESDPNVPHGNSNINSSEGASSKRGGTQINDADEVTSDDEERPSNPAHQAAAVKNLSTVLSASQPSASPQSASTGVGLSANAVPPAPPLLSPSQQARLRGRCLYHVGEHTLFSPFFCPCSAYAYQSIQRQEVWCCKHLLALQLALRVEAAGLPHDDALRVRVVSSEEFAQLLRRAL